MPVDSNTRTNTRTAANQVPRADVAAREGIPTRAGESRAPRIEVGQYHEAAPQVKAAPKHMAESASYDLDQAVASDMGSTGRHFAPVQDQAVQVANAAMEQPVQTAQPRQTMQAANDNARASGMQQARHMAQPQQRPAAAHQPQRIPSLGADDIRNLPAMSSRQTPYTPQRIEAENEILEDALPDELAIGNADIREAAEAQRETADPQAADARKVSAASALTPNTLDGKRSSSFNDPPEMAVKDRSPKLRRQSRKRPSSIIQAVKDRAARAFKRSGVGYRVYGKMNGLPSLGFREIGIGMQEIVAAVDQNPEMVNRLLSTYAGEDVDVSSWSAVEIMQYINSHDIYVATFKPPNNRGQDIQRRKLVILSAQQRGIYLHPVMAAMYTADFDGDDMEVSFDPKVADLAKDPMEHMVGIDGKQSLDTKFLPVAEIVDGYEEGKTARDYVREVMFFAFANIDGRTIRPLVDAVIELGKTSLKDSDTQAAAWGKVFDEARNVADSMRRSRTASNDMMSGLCEAVYRGMRHIWMQNSMTAIGADIRGMDNLPDPRSYDDAAIYKLVDGMVAGEVPNNFQDLKVMLSGFIGNVDKANAPFRFTADVGKMMKMDSRLQIGSGEFVVDPGNTQQMEMFFESTLKFAAARRMAKEIKEAGRSQYYTQLMRDRVITEVGFPERYGSFHEFLTAFYRSYARNSAIINEANLVFMSTMKIDSGSNRGLVSPLNPSRGGVTLGDIAEPFLSIYGTYSVDRMFAGLRSSMRGVDTLWSGNPNKRSRSNRAAEREYDYRGDARFWISGKYASYNLRQFSMENRLIRGETGMDDVYENGKRTKVGIRNTRVDALENMSEVDAQFDLLLAIADKRTGRASTFNKRVYGSERLDNGKSKTTVQMMSDLLVEMDDLGEGGRRDRALWIDDAAMALIESGPDMFLHFGMDSPDAFLQSDIARKMIEHRRDLEKIGGIRTYMVFDYRMERINDLQSKIPDPIADGIERYATAYNELQFAKDELSAASEVWRGIIKEFDAEGTEGQKSVFQMMREGALLQTSPSGRRYQWDIELDARDFWKNPGEHTTLRSVIEDLDLDRATKWNVIADVVRYWEQDAYLKSYEVGYQLEIGADSSYSLKSGATQSVLGAYRDFQESFNRWSKKSRKNIQKNIDDAAKNHRSERGHLMRTLERLDASPWELISIDDGMYADSILSVMDKEYAQTEKASQHPWTNAIYEALSFQRNGGYMNDITRVDDRLLGIQSVESIGIQDIIHLLADPDAELWVYDGGAKAMLTREIILENALGRELTGDIETDIWKFLQQEPRIASAIRKHSACVMADADGSGYIGASLSTNETINDMVNSPSSAIDHVKYLMRDHPVYAAIISLANPAYGSVTRNARKRIAATENYLAHRLYAYASADMQSSQAAEEILADMGITRESVVSALRSDYDSFLDQLGLPVSQGDGGFDNGELEDDALTTYSTALEYTAKYIDEIRSNVRPDAYTGDMPERPDWLGVDTSSAASFWDVVQELSGAKTSVSTGVEGAETYQYGEWASHMDSKDKFADLEAVLDDIDPSWNGMWTSLRNPDGSPILIEVDESGRLANYRQLMQAKREQGAEEIVASVPDGYTVRDRSTDSHGTQVSSLSVFMVSKRSNGAEAFNLKAKKAGIDGKDSITKMQGKHRMVEDGKGGMKRATFFETEYALLQVAQQNGGIMAAKVELASMMLAENQELGYDDMTLANYMNMADMMLIEDAEGNIHLRSMEMLFDAVKQRIGPDIDEMDENQIREAFRSIINDSSENGVGIATMDSLDALAGIRPYSKAGSASGIRSNSSVFERNYDLLSRITESAAPDGVNPISQDRAADLDERNRKVRGIGEIVENLDVARNYSIVGYAAAADGSENINWTVGPSNAIVIGSGEISDDRMKAICDRAYKYGMTVIVGSDNKGKIPSAMVADAMPCSVLGDAIVPCFDMRLNGAESLPYNGGQFAIFQAPYSRYVVSVEDSLNEFELGDAQAKPMKSLTDRMQVVDSGSVKVTAESLFPNVFRNPEFKHSMFAISQASGDEISALISQGVRCTVDYGVVEGGSGFDQRVHDVQNAIDKYISRYQDANADGMVMEDLVPGDIVGWAKCEIIDQFTGDVQYVLAPIIPFPLHGSTKGIPENFSAAQVVSVDNDNTMFAVDWTNTSDIANSNAKYFDSSGGANKGMIDFVDSIDDDRRLMDGTAIDVYIAKPSTDSRKIGTDRRIKTMISLIALARMHGYNFAKSEGAFPSDADHPENAVFDREHPELGGIGDVLMSERIPISKWSELLNGRDMLFTADERLNAFLNYECRKILADGGNPSDYLANVYTDANGVEHNTHVMWEFEAMFEQGLNYEDGLLRFLSTMDSGFCPHGIDDMGEDYTFRLYRDENGSAEGYDNGVLQMRVPHRLSNDSMSYLWDNVYIGMSFFGEDYSGFSRPNVDGASNFLDGMNTMAYYGMELDSASARQRAIWASAGIGRGVRDGGAIGKA